MRCLQTHARLYCEQASNEHSIATNKKRSENLAMLPALNHSLTIFIAAAAEMRTFVKYFGLQGQFTDHRHVRHKSRVRQHSSICIKLRSHQRGRVKQENTRNEATATTSRACMPPPQGTNDALFLPRLVFAESIELDAIQMVCCVWVPCGRYRRARRWRRCGSRSHARRGFVV